MLEVHKTNLINAEMILEVNLCKLLGSRMIEVCRLSCNCGGNLFSFWCENIRNKCPEY